MAKKSRKKKLFIIGGIVIVVAVLVGINMSSTGGNRTSVQAELARIDDIAEVVTASGRIHPQTKVDITSEVPAEIIEVYVNEGDRVGRGQKLLLLDTVQYNSDVEQARYSLDETNARTQAARSQYEKDNKEYERQKSLYEQKLSSETEYANAVFAYENSKANYEAMVAQSKTAQARLDKAVDNLSKTLICAPMEGIITYLSAEAGEIAQAQTSFTQGKTLMTIADLSVYEVEVDVDETEVAKLQLGHAAEIRVDAFRDTAFDGSVVEIGNSALITGEGTDNFSTSFRVKIRFDETYASIRPGMSATVDITTAQEDDVLLIPYAAIVEREFDPDSLATQTSSDTGTSLVSEVHAAEAESDNQSDTSSTANDTADTKNDKKKKVKKSGVFVVKDGKAEFVEVATGLADERHLVALTGVNPGDTVVSGSFQTLRRLSNGDEVEIDKTSLDRMAE